VSRPTPRSALLARLRDDRGAAALLLVAVLVALVWANTPAREAYADLWATELRLGVGDVAVDLDLRHWVNDGLMALFFLVVGIEISRELQVGALRHRRTAAIPAIAALGGMVVPALLYAALNAGGPGGHGWGIVMATDIAFVVGLLAAMGGRVAPGVRVFLLSLAIVDDLGAIAVIAVFYSEGVAVLPLLGALVVVVALVALRPRMHAWRWPGFALAGLALWLLVKDAGVHPTIAGVALGLIVPVVRPEGTLRAAAADRIEHALNPWSSFAVVPVFALANAGVPLDGAALERAASSTVTIGVVLGLGLGKLLGIAGTALAARRLGLGELPAGAPPRQIAAAAWLGGIGFTVSLFVTELAFSDPLLREEAKVGVLAASLGAAAVGVVALRRTTRPERTDTARSAGADGPRRRTRRGPERW
jgi:NhaA family Na+:H+ antiporter